MAPSITVKYERSSVQAGLQAYGLKVTVTSATDVDKEIFVMRRDVTPATTSNPGNPGILPDTFICIADPVDLQELPVLAPDIAHENPYYRVASIELWFRSTTLLEDTYTLIGEDLTKFIASLNALVEVAETEEVTYD